MELNDLSQRLHDATSSFRGKSKQSVLKNSAFDRNLLIDTVFSLITVSEGLMKLNQVNDDNMKNLSDLFAEKTEAMIKKILVDRQVAEPNELSEKRPVHKENHVLIVDNITGNETSSEENFSTQSWADTVKTNISKKLKNIPVTKATVNKQGKGCIFLPNETALSSAQKALENEYNVSKSTRKANIVLPKLKIHNLRSEHVKSVDDLKISIVTKNERISKLLNDNERSMLSVLFFDKKYGFAVIKVSPDIRDIIMETSRLFINMESHYVTDSLFVEQCYACQGYGHKQNSDHCPNRNETSTCMYCTGNHRSSECNQKHNKKKQKCANCNKSTTHDIKNRANTHTANVKTCPVYLKEIEKLKQRTCYDSKNYVENQ